LGELPRSRTEDRRFAHCALSILPQRPIALPDGSAIPGTTLASASVVVCFGEGAGGGVGIKDEKDEKDESALLSFWSFSSFYLSALS
jgi:hypothetical protein